MTLILRQITAVLSLHFLTLHAARAASCTLCHGRQDIPFPQNVALEDGSTCVHMAMDAIFMNENDVLCDSHYRLIGYTKCGCDEVDPSIETTATTTGENEGQKVQCNLCPNGKVISLPNSQFDTTTETTCLQAESYLGHYKQRIDSCISFQNKAMQNCGCVDEHNMDDVDDFFVTIPPLPDEPPPLPLPFCEDDPDFRILINAQTNRYVPCSWIDDAYNLNDVLFRREAQCSKPDVYNACKRACGVAGCCGDNTSHVFALKTGGWVNCEWLKGAVSRREEYCDIKKGSCPESCGICPSVSVPTVRPTSSPTKMPTKSPTKSPTKIPTSSPTNSPTKIPTNSPTKSPMKTPTNSPTRFPTSRPTSKPSSRPSLRPTKAPSTSPSNQAMTESPTVTTTSETTTANPTVSPSSIYIQQPDCTALEAGTVPPTPPNVQIFELMYSLDIVIEEDVTMQDLFNNLQSEFSRITSFAALCPSMEDENENYMNALMDFLELENDKQIQYIQFVNMGKSDDGTCADDASIPNGNTCEVVNGTIQLLYTVDDTASTRRRRRLADSQEIMETLLLELLSYATLKVVQNNNEFVTSLAVHLDTINNGNIINTGQGSKPNGFMSQPGFFIGLGVGIGCLLAVVALLIANKKNKTKRRKQREFNGILPSNADRSDNVWFETKSGVEVLSSTDVNNFDMYSDDGVIGNQNILVSDSEGCFEVKSPRFDDLSKTITSSSSDWRIYDEFPMKHPFENVNLSKMMSSSLVDVDSDSEKSDVFDNVDSDDWTT